MHTSAACSSACSACCLNCLNCSHCALRVALFAHVCRFACTFAFQLCRYEFVSKQFDVSVGVSLGLCAIVDCWSCMLQCAAAIVESFAFGGQDARFVQCCERQECGWLLRKSHGCMCGGGLSVGWVKVPRGTWVAQVFVWNFIACAVVEFDVMLILSSDLSLSILEEGWCSE